MVKEKVWQSAAAVAGLNVFVSFAVGYYVLKNFHHADLREEIFKYFLSYLLDFYYLFKLVLGAFRAIHEATGQRCRMCLKSYSSIRCTVCTSQYPWTVDLNFYIFNFSFCRNWFCISFFIDGYLFDDPYPGYGAVGKDRNEIEKKLIELENIYQLKLCLILKMKIRKVGEIEIYN